MTTLTIRLLGAPQVLFQGQPLKFRSRKILALLIYLLVEGGKHERDKLVDLFWPESDQKRGRSALRITLTRLRKSLEEVGDVVLTEGSLVGFDFAQPVTLDVQILLDVDPSPDTPLETIQSTLAQIQGEFLAGFSLGGYLRF